MSFPAATAKRTTRPLGAVNPRANTLGLTLLYFMWIFTLFEPQRFIPAYTGGGAVAQRFVLLLLVATLFVAVKNAGTRAFYLPLTLFVLVHFLNIPLARNPGLALVGFKSISVIFILFYATVSLIDTPEKSLRILKLILVSFVWYLVQGILNSGHVRWHPTLANPDSFGALAAIAVGFCFYIGMAARSARWRYLGFATAALGMLGIVISFARGAILAGAIVGVFIWIRSPRKMATLAGGFVAIALLMAAISAIYPEGELWDEMKSITEEGNTAGTGKDRWEIWRAAFLVFREHPVLGTGAYNVGVIGSEIIPRGFLDLRYEDPAKLYNKALHNVYLQILSEEGMIGLALWLWMLVDFGRRTRNMRSPGAVAIWARDIGGSFDLYRISLALEVAMMGFLCCAFLYNMTYRHWFYTLVVVAIVVSNSVKNRSEAPVIARRSARKALSS